MAADESGTLRAGRHQESVEMSEETTPARCRVCDRTFPSARLLALHRGVRHPNELDEEEVAAYREAYADEQSELRSIRLRALGALVLLYFGFLFLFAIFAS
jgi:hypothetical protein